MTHGTAHSRGLVEPGSGRSRYDAVIEASGAMIWVTALSIAPVTRLDLNGRKVWADDSRSLVCGASTGRPTRIQRYPEALNAPSRRTKSIRPSQRAFAIELGAGPVGSRRISGRAPDRPMRQRWSSLMVAIDELTRLNDDFGHEATDEIIAVQRRTGSAQ